MRFLGLILLSLACGPSAHAQPSLRLADERVILHTIGGDIVLGFYPDVAPKHTKQILHLVKLGAYDTTHFYRVDESFVAQIGEVTDRRIPLSETQKAAVQRIPAEFSGVPHVRGTLSMAHADGDPDSAMSSFSIILRDAPSLDRNYTVFGRVLHGMDVLDQFTKVPLVIEPRFGTRSRPLVRLEVLSAEVVTEEQLKTRQLVPALRIPVPAAIPDLLRPPPVHPHLIELVTFIAGGMLLVVGVSLFQFLYGPKLSERNRASLSLVVVLICGFTIFVILAASAQASSWFGMIAFLGILAIIKLMGRFENPP